MATVASTTSAALPDQVMDRQGFSNSNSLTLAADKERRIGHRRVDDTGRVSYKKVQSNQLQSSIQLGIQYSIGAMFRSVERDLLMQDFMTVETVFFPSAGSQTTPAHPYSDFTFKTFAPLAFRYFLKLFGVRREDFMMCLCSEPLRELSNPGASGSIFYLTHGDEFILKTVQHKEALFLQKLLPGYYMNLNQNSHTLLPKFFGMYCYQYNQKNIRLTVMNNLLPSNVKIHLKFDLKGSTCKRKADKHERNKRCPTFKDLDFIEMFPDGIYLEQDTHAALITTLRRDCRVLESFRIMDYSLLVGIHNLDAQDSDIKCSSSTEDLTTSGGIPARTPSGDRLLLYLGIIDILQSYRLRKRMEHTLKSIVYDGDTVSVHRPSFYAGRFLDFMANSVFKRMPSALRHSPSRRQHYTSHHPIRREESSFAPESSAKSASIHNSPASLVRSHLASSDHDDHRRLSTTVISIGGRDVPSHIVYTTTDNSNVNRAYPPDRAAKSVENVYRSSVLTTSQQSSPHSTMVVERRSPYHETQI